MSLREKMNKNSSIMVIAAAVAIAVGLYVIYAQVKPTSTAKGAYYTIDDGKSWFEDDIGLVPPYLHEGKEAVKAHVFSCNGKEFVAFMVKYTPEYKALAEKAANAAKSESGKPDSGAKSLQQQLAMMQMTHQLIKKPGGPKWLRPLESGGDAIMNVVCSDGSSPEAVTPAGYAKF